MVVIRYFDTDGSKPVYAYDEDGKMYKWCPIANKDDVFTKYCNSTFLYGGGHDAGAGAAMDKWKIYAIIFPIIGLLVILILLGLCCYFICCRKRPHNTNSTAVVNAAGVDEQDRSPIIPESSSACRHCCIPVTTTTAASRQGAVATAALAATKVTLEPSTSVNVVTLPKGSGQNVGQEIAPRPSVLPLCGHCCFPVKREGSATPQHAAVTQTPTATATNLKMQQAVLQGPIASTSKTAPETTILPAPAPKKVLLMPVSEQEHIADSPSEPSCWQCCFPVKSRIPAPGATVQSKQVAAALEQATLVTAAATTSVIATAIPGTSRKSQLSTSSKVMLALPRKNPPNKGIVLQSENIGRKPGDAQLRQNIHTKIQIQTNTEAPITHPIVVQTERKVAQPRNSGETVNSEQLSPAVKCSTCCIIPVAPLDDNNKTSSLIPAASGTTKKPSLAVKPFIENTSEIITQPLKTESMLVENAGLSLVIKDKPPLTFEQAPVSTKAKTVTRQKTPALRDPETEAIGAVAKKTAQLRGSDGIEETGSSKLESQTKSAGQNTIKLDEDESRKESAVKHPTNVVVHQATKQHDEPVAISADADHAIEEKRQVDVGDKEKDPLEGATNHRKAIEPKPTKKLPSKAVATNSLGTSAKKRQLSQIPGSASEQRQHTASIKDETLAKQEAVATVELAPLSGTKLSVLPVGGEIVEKALTGAESERKRHSHPEIVATADEPKNIGQPAKDDRSKKAGELKPATSKPKSKTKHSPAITKRFVIAAEEQKSTNEKVKILPTVQVSQEDITSNRPHEVTITVAEVDTVTEQESKALQSVITEIPLVSALESIRESTAQGELMVQSFQAVGTSSEDNKREVKPVQINKMPTKSTDQLTVSINNDATKSPGELAKLTPHKENVVTKGEAIAPNPKTAESNVASGVTLPAPLYASSTGTPSNGVLSEESLATSAEHQKGQKPIRSAELAGPLLLDVTKKSEQLSSSVDNKKAHLPVLPNEHQEIEHHEQTEPSIAVNQQKMSPDFQDDKSKAVKAAETPAVKDGEGKSSALLDAVAVDLSLELRPVETKVGSKEEIEPQDSRKKLDPSIPEVSGKFSVQGARSSAVQHDSVTEKMDGDAAETVVPSSLKPAISESAEQPKLVDKQSVELASARKTKLEKPLFKRPVTVGQPSDSKILADSQEGRSPTATADAKSLVLKNAADRKPGLTEMTTRKVSTQHEDPSKSHVEVKRAGGKVESKSRTNLPKTTAQHQEDNIRKSGEKNARPVEAQLPSTTTASFYEQSAHLEKPVAESDVESDGNKLAANLVRSSPAEIPSDDLPANDKHSSSGTALANKIAEEEDQLEVRQHKPIAVDIVDVLDDSKKLFPSDTAAEYSKTHIPMLDLASDHKRLLVDALAAREEEFLKPEPVSSQNYVVNLVQQQTVPSDTGEAQKLAVRNSLARTFKDGPAMNEENKKSTKKTKPGKPRNKQLTAIVKPSATSAPKPQLGDTAQGQLLTATTEDQSSIAKNITTNDRNPTPVELSKNNISRSKMLSQHGQSFKKPAVVKNSTRESHSTGKHQRNSPVKVKIIRMQSTAVKEDPMAPQKAEVKIPTRTTSPILRNAQKDAAIMVGLAVLSDSKSYAIPHIVSATEIPDGKEKQPSSALASTSKISQGHQEVDQLKTSLMGKTIPKVREHSSTVDELDFLVADSEKKDQLMPETASKDERLSAADLATESSKLELLLKFERAASQVEMTKMQEPTNSSKDVVKDASLKVGRTEKRMDVFESEIKTLKKKITNERARIIKPVKSKSPRETFTGASNHVQQHPMAIKDHPSSQSAFTNVVKSNANIVESSAAAPNSSPPVSLAAESEEHQPSGKMEGDFNLRQLDLAIGQLSTNATRSLVVTGQPDEGAMSLEVVPVKEKLLSLTKRVNKKIEENEITTKGSTKKSTTITSKQYKRQINPQKSSLIDNHINQKTLNQHSTSSVDNYQIAASETSQQNIRDLGLISLALDPKVAQTPHQQPLLPTKEPMDQLITEEQNAYKPTGAYKQSELYFQTVSVIVERKENKLSVLPTTVLSEQGKESTKPRVRAAEQRLERNISTARNTMQVDKRQPTVHKRKLVLETLPESNTTSVVPFTEISTPIESSKPLTAKATHQRNNVNYFERARTPRTRNKANLSSKTVQSKVPGVGFSSEKKVVGRTTQDEHHWPTAATDDRARLLKNATARKSGRTERTTRKVTTQYGDPSKRRIERKHEQDLPEKKKTSILGRASAGELTIQEDNQPQSSLDSTEIATAVQHMPVVFSSVDVPDPNKRHKFVKSYFQPVPVMTEKAENEVSVLSTSVLSELGAKNRKTGVQAEHNLLRKISTNRNTMLVNKRQPMLPKSEKDRRKVVPKALSPLQSDTTNIAVFTQTSTHLNGTKPLTVITTRQHNIVHHFERARTPRARNKISFPSNIVKSKILEKNLVGYTVQRGRQSQNVANKLVVANGKGGKQVVKASPAISKLPADSTNLEVKELGWTVHSSKTAIGHVAMPKYNGDTILNANQVVGEVPRSAHSIVTSNKYALTNVANGKKLSTRPLKLRRVGKAAKPVFRLVLQKDRAKEPLIKRTKNKEIYNRRLHATIVPPTLEVPKYSPKSSIPKPVSPSTWRRRVRSLAVTGHKEAVIHEQPPQVRRTWRQPHVLFPRRGKFSYKRTFIRTVPSATTQQTTHQLSEYNIRNKQELHVNRGRTLIPPIPRNKQKKKISAPITETKQSFTELEREKKLADDKLRETSISKAGGGDVELGHSMDMIAQKPDSLLRQSSPSKLQTVSPHNRNVKKLTRTRRNQIASKQRSSFRTSPENRRITNAGVSDNKQTTEVATTSKQQDGEPEHTILQTQPLKRVDKVVGKHRRSVIRLLLLRHIRYRKLSFKPILHLKAGPVTKTTWADVKHQVAVETSEKSPSHKRHPIRIARPRFRLSPSGWQLKQRDKYELTKKVTEMGNKWSATVGRQAPSPQPGCDDCDTNYSVRLAHRDRYSPEASLVVDLPPRHVQYETRRVVHRRPVARVGSLISVKQIETRRFGIYNADSSLMSGLGRRRRRLVSCPRCPPGFDSSSPPSYLMANARRLNQQDSVAHVLKYSPESYRRGTLNSRILGFD